MPENTPAELTDEQVAERIAGILSEYAALNLTDESNEDDIAKGETLATELGEMRILETARKDEAVKRADRVHALQDAFTPPPPGATVQEPEPVAEPAPAAAAVQPVPETVSAPVAAPAPVTAAAVPPARRAAANAPEMRLPNDPGVTLLAAADVPGFSTGSELNGLEQATEAIMNRMRALPTHNLPNTRLRFGAAIIKRHGFGELVQDTMNDYQLIQQAGNEKRLKGGSLVAAGGWCAPSETLYDLCQMETLDGLLSIPEVQVNRGGIRYTPGPDFSDIYNSANGFWDISEAEAIAGTPAKTCYTVTCPAFTDVRLDAYGVCIKVPILTNVGFPELTTRITSGAIIAHQHKVNARVLSIMEQAAGTAVVVPDQGTLAFNMDHLEWQAQAIREAYQLADGASVEVVLPTSARPLIRAEFGRRTGVNFQAITDAEINAWFTARNMAVQFVRDWQPMTAGHALQAVPATIKALMYPAGSWVKGVQDVINLDVVYDSADLVNNIYTGLFMEEGALVVQKCLGTTLLSIPVCVSGQTAAAAITDCMGTATP